MVWRLTRTYRWVRNRIDELEPVLLPSERFILVFGFIEKVVRRTFVHICMRKGMTEAQAVAQSKTLSLMDLNGEWRHVAGKTLREVIQKKAWKQIHRGAELRNELIHGRGHKDQRIYREAVEGLLGMLDDMRGVFSSEYGYSGWQKRKQRRK